jgi:hypothetical protein
VAHRVSATIALAGVLATGACGGSADRRPTEESLSDADRAAAVRVVNLVSDAVNTGAFDRYWAVLHPAHQALISSEDFERCWTTGILGISTSSKLLSVERVEVDRPGVEEHDAVAVRYERKGKWEDGESYEETLTRDVVKVDDRWRYLLDEEYVEDLRRGICPVNRFVSIDKPN